MYDFGLTHEQFLDLTPAQFAALSDRHDVSSENAHFGPANICAILANIHRDEKTRPTPYSFRDFMPRYGDEPDERVEEEQSWEHIMAHLKALFPPPKQKPTESHGG